jgi:hypothetical protein
VSAVTELEPLKLTEVVTANVGSPRNDGTSRSGLYAVPLQLNRAVTDAESRLLAEVWDAPPSFTSMHRRGILRAWGDRIVLDGTTIEEVKQYHAQTLRTVINEVNRRAAELRTREQEAVRRAEEAGARHRANVEDVASDIDLG